jgi:hypothetical protein
VPALTTAAARDRVRHRLARDHSAFFGHALKSQTDDAFDVLYSKWFFEHVYAAEIEELRQ